MTSTWQPRAAISRTLPRSTSIRTDQSHLGEFRKADRVQRVQVTPQMVTDAAASCDSTNAEIDAELAALRSFVVNLQSQWHGVASDQFNALMTDFDIYGKMLHSALSDIASGLRGNAVNYVDTEISNINSLVAVNGDIPGARL
ncbi:WXG100 family type VII secretion target [Micromonospora lupini]|uniref:WXG100 family type VII secretion target n=1 Tax=Micromonospora lupini TaxID=285679 RepID=UPI0033E72E04